MCIGIYNYKLHAHNYVPSNWPSFCMAALYNNLTLQGIITAYLSCSKQGRIQEFKGGGAEVKYVQARKCHPWPCPLWCVKWYAEMGGEKLREA